MHLNCSSFLHIYYKGNIVITIFILKLLEIQNLLVITSLHSCHIFYYLASVSCHFAKGQHHLLRNNSCTSAFDVQHVATLLLLNILVENASSLHDPGVMCPLVPSVSRVPGGA